MNTHFTAGFGNELIKEARIRATIGRLVGRGKDYMRRRRLAKKMGVKPADVDKVLAIQAKRARRKKMVRGGAALASAGAVGGYATKSLRE